MADWNDWYPRYPKTQRRKAKDGIAARSRSGRIGESWWSGRFLQALESAAITTRLSRGRSYARSGQVMDLDVGPGRVTARVQGSRAKPYAVRIDIDPFSDAEWERVERTMAARALFLAKLLAGDMPHEIEESFTATGLALFPAARRGLRTECSCPDMANPCKHIAATFYILAEAFDTDPFLIFSWRGRTRPQLLERLRELRGAAARDVRPPDIVGTEVVDSARASTPPLDASIDGFWSAGDRSPAAGLPNFDGAADALMRELGPASIEVGRRDLTDLLAPLYRVFTAHARERLEADPFAPE
jgi:uncharacterized Zn finger protein